VQHQFAHNSIDESVVSSEKVKLTLAPCPQSIEYLGWIHSDEKLNIYIPLEYHQTWKKKPSQVHALAEFLLPGLLHRRWL
jgi:hypothetical protein